MMVLSTPSAPGLGPGTSMVKWTPNPGPLDRAYLLRPFPISTGGGATIPDLIGHRLQESLAETTSGRLRWQQMHWGHSHCDHAHHGGE
jgi:hypothetical protein